MNQLIDGLKLMTSSVLLIRTFASQTEYMWVYLYTQIHVYQSIQIVYMQRRASFVSLDFRRGSAILRTCFRERSNRN